MLVDARPRFTSQRYASQQSDLKAVGEARNEISLMNTSLLSRVHMPSLAILYLSSPLAGKQLPSYQLLKHDESHLYLLDVTKVPQEWE